MDKAALFTARTSQREVTVEGIGVFTVRGLSRAEVLRIQDIAKGDSLITEQLIVSMGSVDPQLTQDEVAQWQAVALATEMDPVSTAIAELSGLSARADKETYRSFRG